ncbi:DUF4832 domain-containing protein [Mariniphaga anaerophila]|nr:DUF4832 domain-containing protein [Mariniphaga anaerophila]
MEGINRREFLNKMGLATTGMLSVVIVPNNMLSTNHSLKKGRTDPSDIYEFFPEDNGKALVNPDMGWTMHFYSNLLSNYGSKLAPSDTLDDFPGLSTVYLRIPWAFVQPEENQYTWEILDTPAQRWIEKGKKVAFRITATENWMHQGTPQWVFDAGAKYYKAHDYIEPDYDDPVFVEKVEKFVAKMAEKYDENPNVAFVDVGHYGMWGEGHTIVSTPVHGKSWGIKTQKKHIDIYCRHFKKTLLCISDDYAGAYTPGKRFPIMDYAFSRGVTMRDDSILVQKAPKQWFHSEMAQLFWPSLPVILEHEHYEGSKARGCWNKELLIQSIEDYHASYMSIHTWPRLLLNENEDVISRINRRLGYRLQVTHLVYPKEIKKSESFIIQSVWKNVGVAPCYAGGYPCFTLKDKKGGIVSVLVDPSFNVKKMQPAPPGEAAEYPLTSSFVVAPSFHDIKGLFSRTCLPGTYDLYISVGTLDGTPIFELPYNNSDSHKRYKIGNITLAE